MSQHDFSIANQTASNARADINNALQALATNNSGNSAPSTTYANMWWFENDTNRLKIRNEANSAWINVAYLNGTEWSVLDNTKVKTTTGTQTGLLGDQTTGTWQTGTGTTESLVSPAKVKAAIQNIAPNGSYSSSSKTAEFSNGFQLRWGTISTTSDDDQAFTFSGSGSSAFSTGCFVVIVAGEGRTVSVSRTGFVFNRENDYNGTFVFQYMAFGH